MVVDGITHRAHIVDIGSGYWAIPAIARVCHEHERT